MHKLIKATVLVVGGAILVAGGYISLKNNPAESGAREQFSQQVGGGFVGDYHGAAATIVRTDNGYEPKEVTVRKGETVSFKNETGKFHWPASNVHPTHSIYSEFDPREPIAPWETWSFTFTELGSWKFHDHIRANKQGSVHVIE